jgi:hypothetical protein
MNPEGRQRRISDVTLEQYLLGELPKNEMVETKRLIEDDATLRARLEELERSNREILEQYPPDVMSREIQSRLDRQALRTRFVRTWSIAAFAGAAAVAFLLLLFLPHELITTSPGDDAPLERIKGEGPHLDLYRKTPSGSESLEDGAPVFPGDVIGLAYQAAGRLYGVILSVDGRGTVTLHVPHQGSRSIRLNNDGRIVLDFALELDDAPRWERFYFVTADTPFDASPVMRAARQIDTQRPIDRPEKLDLPQSLDQFVVSLMKGTE